jgi:hypothetical protein
MSNTTLHARLASLVISIMASFSMLALGACATDPGELEPPPGSHPAALDATGSFQLRSTYSLGSPPTAAATMLAELAKATDGPDDPARFLIDRLVARMPEGQTQAIAAAVAPYLAAYVQARIDRVAPNLADGLHRLGDGLDRIARRWSTNERLDIGHDGRAVRVVTGLDFDGIGVSFAEVGASDVEMSANVALDRDQLTIGEHAAELPYGLVLREGLDRAVVPRIVTGASSLDTALAMLVDCATLGELASEYVGIGSPELYAGACRVALTHLAAEIYDQLDVGPAQMVVSGTARVIDLDGDGPIELIADGAWKGTIGNAPLAQSTFEARAR